MAVGDGGLGEHELAPSPPESVESFFAATGEPRLFLDQRLAESGSAASGWLREFRSLRSIGALAMEQQFFPTVPAGLFDVLVYVRTTRGAIQLDTSPYRR